MYFNFKSLPFHNILNYEGVYVLHIMLKIMLYMNHNEYVLYVNKGPIYIYDSNIDTKYIYNPYGTTLHNLTNLCLEIQHTHES